MAKTSLMSLYDVNAQPTNSEKAEKPFRMTGELGLMVETGNSNGATYAGRIDADHDMDDWNNRYIAEFLYKQREVERDGSSVNEVTAQRSFFSAQFDYKLENPKNRLFVYSEIENDRFKGFDYQASVAAGWSSQAWKNDSSELKYSIGPGYGFTATDNQQQNAENGFIWRASMEYKYGLNEHTLIRQFLSTEAGQANTKSKSETSLSSRIFGELAMKLSFIMNHNADVQDNINPLDTETRVALVYNFF